MPVTWADVSALDPALASIPLASQTAILADAILQVSPTTWEARTDLGVKSGLIGSRRRRGRGAGNPMYG